MSRHLNRAAVVPLALLIAALSGCGQHGETAPPSQVAARVNSDEITIYQVNYVLSHSPVVTAGNAEQAKRAVLRSLVDQELAKQQAMKEKLDRSPQVLQALEQARTDVLARAYLDRIAAEQPRPTDADVKAYYSGHPELFARRRVFDLDEIALEAKDAMQAEVRERIAKTTSMAELTKWLQAQGIKYAEDRVTRPAEQIPLTLLPELQAMKNGEIQLVHAGRNRLEVVQVVASRTAPVDEATAAPRIREYLFNRRASDAVATAMARLRSQAKITYLGEFAGGVAGTAELPAKAGAAIAAPAPSGGVEKGVKGLFK